MLQKITYKNTLLFVCLFVTSIVINAQNIQLYTEDFQTGGLTFTLNASGNGSNTGNNQWVINSAYSGVPLYPNTMGEDSTYAGTIAFAPNSSYLHIYDNASGINNCNYDATNASDRFANITNGFCTLGMDSVHFSFFYLCQGSGTAYGSVYYSANNGPWIQVGQAQYNNKYKWKYEDITDPAFSNVANLRFGFRWQNDAGSNPSTESFGIDDINIVATYNTISPVTITVDSVSPSPVCQGTYLSVYYHLSDTLCDGTYQIELSNSAGNFPSTFSSWVVNMNYTQTNGFAYIQLPNGATPAGCYKIRVSRTSPAPAITGIASACFTIQACANVINTLQPVITHDTNAVCVGSAIDIPFTSTGVYLFNTYTAELSDSTGTFPATPIVVGTFANSDTYDPSLGANPGSVSGLVPDVPNGCNYYIRVVSDGPAAVGSAWGPFCIHHCDITTNNTTDLSFCVQDCSVAPAGLNSLITVNANTYNDTAIYNPGNLFTTQLLSSMDFSQIGTNGILGSQNATNDTTLNVHIPCKDSLATAGIPTGMNYMRVVGDNSTQPDNGLGSLIRVTIGAIRSTPQIISSYDYGAPYDFNLPYPWIPLKDTFCSGETVMLMFEPYSYSDNSTYKWTCTGINGGNPFVSPSGANSNTLYVNLGGPGTLDFRIQETNYGCTGAWSPVHSIVVLGPPSVAITGPAIACQNDTVSYQVPYSNGTYYHWSTNGTILDTANNEINLEFPTSTGSHTLTINAINQCGSASYTKTVVVKPHPTANAGNDTTVCVNQPVTLTTNTGTGYTYLWTDASTTVGTTNSVTVTPTSTTTYALKVTGAGGCLKKDSVLIQVQQPDSTYVLDSVCPNGSASIVLKSDTTGAYLWSTGAATSQITVSDTGQYNLAIGQTNQVCPKVLAFTVKPDVCPVDLHLPNVFSPNGDGNNDFFTPVPPGEFGVYRFDKFNIKIFNRWGQLVYEASEVAFKWNGNNKSGKAESDGVYYYVVETSSNGTQNKPLNGFVTLTK